MILIWSLLGVLGVTLLLILLRLDLGRMAFRYLLSNPKQTGLAVLGLMISTSTLVGASVVTDSAASTLEERMSALHGTTDVVVYPRWGFEGYDSIRHMWGVGGVIGAADVQRTHVPAFAENGLLANDVAVYGIDKNYPFAVKWEPSDGDIDEDLFMTRSMAARLDAEVGSNVSLIFPDPKLPAPPWEYEFGSTKQAGYISRHIEGPEGREVNGPDDDDVFLLRVPDRSVNVDFIIEIEAQRTAGAAPAFHYGEYKIDIESPDGHHMVNYTGPADATQSWSGAEVLRVEQRWNATDEFLPGGNYIFRLDANGSVRTEIRVQWFYTMVEGTAPWEWHGTPPVVFTMPLKALVDDSADPAGDGQAIFIPKANFTEATYGVKTPTVVVARVEDSAHIDGLTATFQHAVKDPEAEVVDLRTAPQEAAAELRQEMTMMWTFMSGFTVAAAMVLLFVLIALLVDERKSTLATVRAIGGQRHVLIRVQAFEVAGLAVLAGATGGLLGLLVAKLLAGSTNDIWVVGDLRYQPLVILNGIAVAVLFIMLFSAFAAWRSSRIEIAPALRGLEAPARGSRIRDVIVAVALMGAGTYLAATARADDPIGLTSGMPLLVLGAGLFLSRWIPKGLVYPLVGAAFLLWMVATTAVLSEIDSGMEALILPLRAILFAVGGALLFVYASPLYRFVNIVFSWVPGSMHVEHAVAQWRRRPARASLTIIMLAMMLMSVLFLSSLMSAQDQDNRESAGGFNIVAHSTDELGDLNTWLDEHPPLLDADPFTSMADYAVVPATYFTSVHAWNETTLGIRAANGVTPVFAELQTFTTIEGPPADEIFQQALRDPGLIILDKDLGHSDAEPHVGDIVQFTNRLTGNKTELTVAAIVDGSRMGGVYMHPAALNQVAVQRHEGPLIGTSIFAMLDDGADPDLVAAQIETRFLDAGMDAQTVGYEESDVEAIQAILSIYVVLAMAVGGVALALISARNVVQRRREIGMLRSIGASRSRIVTTILLETWLLVGMAIAIGWMGAALMIQGLELRGLSAPDIMQAVYLSIYTLVLGALAAIVPAYGAARLNPAVAVRNME